jgi:tetratricopeptide (TPR) repeat protein
VGVGYPTDFFLKKTINGKEVLVENDRFGLRFFPPELARSPSPLVMEKTKPKDTCRIFILGESAALGDPEPAFGFGRYLEVLLRDRFPKKRFEVICTAITAINSHVILPIARECVRRDGDIWVVYMGNNEFVGPYGPGTVFGPQAPPLSLIRLSLALKATRLGQLLSRLASRSSSKNWGGMKMFLENQVAPEDPRKQRVYDHFRANLEAILTAAHRAGAGVVLSTVAVNLKDCPPFASQSAKLTEYSKAQWQGLFNLGIQEQRTNYIDGAISNYQAAAQIDASFAELQFRWGQCLLALTNSAEARMHFERAGDCDALPFRADERLNEIIRQSAARTRDAAIRLVDSAALLADSCPAHILGNELLYEHVHLNFEGNYLLARGTAEAVSGLLPKEARTDAPADWESFDRCSQQLALTAWDRRRVYENLQRRLSEPPFTGQLNHAAQLESFAQALAALRPVQTPQALEEARKLYQQRTEAEPSDLYLRAGFAKLEEDVGNLPAAMLEWKALRDEIPFTAGPHFYLAKVLARMGKSQEALEELDATLAIRPDLPEALSEKGRLLAKVNRGEDGLKLLDTAAALEPGNARICMDRAEVLASMGRRGEAETQLQQAVQLQPGYWEAHYLLGVELAFDGQFRSAAEQFLEAVRLNPGYTLAHLNLGIALAKLNRLDEASAQFQETLRLDPNNRKASEYLEALRKADRRKR